MPNRDGTGPKGKGLRTGRGIGKCGDQKNNATSRPRRNRSARSGLGQKSRDS